MRLTKVAEINQYVVTYQGRAFWFNTKEQAESFMRSVEDELLYI